MSIRLMCRKDEPFCLEREAVICAPGKRLKLIIYSRDFQHALT
ncbi:hypothetical protein BH18ACI2_BH18ACI2_14030 [soil metagenome]